MKSPCPVCRESVADVTKRWTEGLGFCCVMCAEFLESADKTLRRVGVEGVAVAPERFLPEGRES